MSERQRFARSRFAPNSHITIMASQFCPEIPEPVIFVVLWLALIAVEGVGWRVGQRYREGADEAARSQVGSLQAAVLGLLALLLGFTFSMAADRFDARRELIVEEANSIGTAHLRSDLVSEPARGSLKTLLERYVDTRVAFYTSGGDETKRRAAEVDGERIHAQLWPLATAEARREPTPTAALLVEALNTLIDLHASRVAALSNHVPSIVIWMLLVVAVLSAAITGYTSGFSTRHYRLPAMIVMLLIAAVTLVIIDLDRPRRGLIHSGQTAMLELQRKMKQTEAHPP
jgi:hypothetical protein